MEVEKYRQEEAEEKLDIERQKMELEKIRQLQEDKKLVEVAELRKQADEQRKLEEKKLAKATQQRALEEKKIKHEEDIQKFRNLAPESTQTFLGFSAEVQVMLENWLKAAKVNGFDGLKELIVKDHIKGLQTFSLCIAKMS